jgi:hypothetical protein
LIVWSSVDTAYQLGFDRHAAWSVEVNGARVHLSGKGVPDAGAPEPAARTRERLSKNRPGGHWERLPTTAGELVALKVDVLVPSVCGALLSNEHNSDRGRLLQR